VVSFVDGGVDGGALIGAQKVTVSYNDRSVAANPSMATADGHLMMLLPEQVDALGLTRGSLIDDKEHGDIYPLPTVNVTYKDSENKSHTVSIDAVYQVPAHPKKNHQRYATGLIAWQLLNAATLQINPS
jgi:hypothetical protein